MRIVFFSAPLLVPLVFANTIPAQTVKPMTKLDTTGENHLVQWTQDYAVRSAPANSR